jgi:hypothetical protein
MIAAIWLLSLSPSASVAAFGALDDAEDVTGERMAADAFVVRPVGAVATLLGSVVYVISLPFSYSGGNQQQAYEALVVDPAEFTFRRPLGDDF